jgi:hypothetical protein
LGVPIFSEPKSGILLIFLMEEKQLGASLRQFEQRKWQLPKMKLNFLSVTIGIKLEPGKSEKFSAFCSL